MYQFSRSIYREIADEIVESRRPRFGAPTNHELVLRACEAAIVRLATDQRYFAHPTKTLFRDIRAFFPVCEQQRVYRVIDRHMALARTWLAEQAIAGVDVLGNPIQCRATTRKGTACQRPPQPVNGYCPSHQHLAEGEELVGLAA